MMSYLNMLKLYLLPQLEVYQPNVMFQQGDAPPNWAHVGPEFLPCIFLIAGLEVMDQFHELRPPSPGIISLDIFLWGYIYKTPR
jgi:hypothetical protein